MIDTTRLDANGHLNLNWNFIWQVSWRDYKLNFHPAPIGVAAPCLPTIDGVTPPPIDIGAHICKVKVDRHNMILLERPLLLKIKIFSVVIMTRPSFPCVLL